MNVVRDSKATDHLAEAQKFYTEMQLLDTRRVAQIIDRVLGTPASSEKIIAMR